MDWISFIFWIGLDKDSRPWMHRNRVSMNIIRSTLEVHCDTITFFISI